MTNEDLAREIAASVTEYLRIGTEPGGATYEDLVVERIADVLREAAAADAMGRDERVRRLEAVAEAARAEQRARHWRRTIPVTPGHVPPRDVLEQTLVEAQQAAALIDDALYRLDAEESDG